jgi:hypothetical protein
MAYILGILFPTLWVLNYPPEMAGKVNCAALIRLLEELASMQGSLGNQRIVVLLGEPSGSVQGTRDDADGLELSSRVTDRVFVDRECLREEFVANFLKSCLVGNFTTHDEQPKSELLTHWCRNR